LLAFWFRCSFVFFHDVELAGGRLIHPTLYGLRRVWFAPSPDVSETSVRVPINRSSSLFADCPTVVLVIDAIPNAMIAEMRRMLALFEMNSRLLIRSPRRRGRAELAALQCRART